jgi:hypothetical protein
MVSVMSVQDTAVSRTLDYNFVLTWLITQEYLGVLYMNDAHMIVSIKSKAVLLHHADAKGEKMHSSYSVHLSTSWG